MAQTSIAMLASVPAFRARQGDHRNVGTCGTLIEGGGGDTMRDALPIPLGSLRVEFLIWGIPLMADGPAPAEPAIRIGLGWKYEPVVAANEPAVDARIRQTASATLTFDMERLHRLNAPQLHVG